MICKSCIAKRCDHCDNYYDSKGNERPKDGVRPTWCDCKHKTGIWVDSNQCKHYTYVEGMKLCPMCGKDMTVDTTDSKETPAS